MLYNYNEIINKYGNNYKLNKAIKNGEIAKISSGLYSDDYNNKDLPVFIKKYNDPIFTLESAFYYYGISDTIPNKYHIAVSKNGTKYSSSLIKAYYMNEILSLGKTNIDYLGTNIKIYSKERLLIELIRYKNSLPYDYYKEIINYYRSIINQLNIQSTIDMISKFPKKNMIYKTLQNEVL